MKMKMKGMACELCNQQAFLFCPSDSAFLCFNCDAAVHQANFLVARHIRYLLCSKCNRFSGNYISGAGASPSTCRACLPLPENTSDFLPSSSSPSSACVSSSESCATSTASKKIKLKNTTMRKRKRMTTRTRSCSSSVSDDASSAVEQGGSVVPVEVFFVKWSRELGLGVKGNCVASLASRALAFCKRKWKALPLRVAAATSFWLGLRFCAFENQILMRLEIISGVPAQLILAAHAKLARAFTHRRDSRLQPQEGRDES